jgi:TatA/E family protein of Tat protein translocase
MNSLFAFIEGIGGMELLVIMFIVLMLFGPKRLPELAKGLGKTIREVKKATSGVEAEVRRAMEEDPTPPKKQPVGALPQNPPSATNGRTTPPPPAAAPTDLAE